MAISEVASQRASKEGSAASDTLAFPNNVTSGNLLIIAGALYGNGGMPTLATPTDTRSTTYSVLQFTHTVGSDNYRYFIAYGIAQSSGACTVTIDPSVGAYSFHIDEFTGVDSTPLDVDGGNSNGNSSSASDALTTGVADALIIGIETHAAGGAITPGGSYTQIGEIESQTNQASNAVFRIATTATSYTVDWTVPSGVWDCSTASFKPTAGVTFEQTHFRFFKDDGDEDASTGEAAEDTDISVAVATRKRLRNQVKSTGADPPSRRRKFRYRKVGDDGWRDPK